jgi:hypothetical protein
MKTFSFTIFATVAPVQTIPANTCDRFRCRAMEQMLFIWVFLVLFLEIGLVNLIVSIQTRVLYSLKLPTISTLSFR